MENKSGLDKQIEKKIIDKFGTVYIFSDDDYDDLIDVTSDIISISSQAVQEAHQQGVSDTLGKVRDEIEKDVLNRATENLKYLQTLTINGDDLVPVKQVAIMLYSMSDKLKPILSALDHLEEEK